MRKSLIPTLVLLLSVNIIFAQRNSFNIKLLAGPAYADTATFLATDFSLGYEFQKNRIEFNIQSGSKKRTEYSNGDFADALMINYTLTYSRLFKKNKFSFFPKLGAGYVSGRWNTTYEMDDSQFIPMLVPRSKLLTGFGLNYGVGVEYSVLKFMSLNLSYNEALLLSDISGNRALFAGVVFKISKKSKDEVKEDKTDN